MTFFYILKIRHDGSQSRFCHVGEIFRREFTKNFSKPIRNFPMKKPVQKLFFAQARLSKLSPISWNSAGHHSIDRGVFSNSQINGGAFYYLIQKQMLAFQYITCFIARINHCIIFHYIHDSYSRVSK